MGFRNGLAVERIGYRGGLLLSWNDEVDATIQSFSKGHVDALVKMPGNTIWRFTGVYGEPRQNFSTHFWSLIRILHSVSRIPWLLGGDFNEILKAEEKNGLSKVL